MLMMIRAYQIIKKFLLSIVLLFCAAELLARIFVPVSYSPHISNPPMFQPDPSLGYRLRPNLLTKAHSVQGGKKIFEVDYRIDEFGRRYVPIENPLSRDQHFIILGSSTAFGMGLEDKFTLASNIAKANPRLMPYNYAVDGYGPQQSYILASADELKKNILQKKGYSVFFFQMINKAGGHPQTLLGRFELQLDAWGEWLPLYKIEKGMPAEPIGFMKDHAPIKFHVYRFLQMFHILNILHPYVFPISDDELQKTADFMRLIQDAVLVQQPETQFIVVIHPLSDRHIANNIVSRMQKNGIQVLDLSNLIPEDKISEYIAFKQYFPHPNGKLNEKLAQELSRYLTKYQN